MQPTKGRHTMTLDQMKTHYFNEATELGMASEDDIERLCVWLEANDFDSDCAWAIWSDAAEELEYMMADLAAEFA
jgi:hypothetical protein|tara:strand:+ start:698 stop:922 length:225 start_codon:yes stop_codon:yes gene_type:complete